MDRFGRLTISETKELEANAQLNKLSTGAVQPFWCGAYYDPITEILCLLHPVKATADEQLAFIMSYRDLVPVLVSTLPKSRTNRSFWQLRGNLVIDPGEV